MHIRYEDEDGNPVDGPTYWKDGVELPADIVFDYEDEDD